MKLYGDAQKEGVVDGKKFSKEFQAEYRKPYLISNCLSCGSTFKDSGSIMSDIKPIRLLVILSEDNKVTMELRRRFPNSLEELINAVNNAFALETKFLAQLEKHSAKLLEVLRSHGGRVKEQATRVLKVLDETVDITIRRECILKSLMIYLGEPVQHLLKNT
ncbi:hypothetical protein ATANTOWER_009764, partial [Ataeniobius toweri]|nr:hypothetical protein [Ataeniobius toweri]